MELVLNFRSEFRSLGFLSFAFPALRGWIPIGGSYPMIPTESLRLSLSFISFQLETFKSLRFRLYVGLVGSDSLFGIHWALPCPDSSTIRRTHPVRLPKHPSCTLFQISHRPPGPPSSPTCSPLAFNMLLISLISFDILISTLDLAQDLQISVADIISRSIIHHL